MTVYVDTMQAPFGRMKMCHCWADSRDELFAAMTAIGVQHKWFQRPDGDCDFGMDASWEHFDISQSKKALAIKNGAVEVSMYVMAQHANLQKFIKSATRGHLEQVQYALKMIERTGRLLNDNLR